MSEPEIIIVAGLGLKAVHARSTTRDGRPRVEYAPHGHPIAAPVAGCWAYTASTRTLTPDEAREAIAFERAQAIPRGVGCADPSCWCRGIVP
jgi:hypothetical protein